MEQTNSNKNDVITKPIIRIPNKNSIVNQQNDLDTLEREYEKIIHYMKFARKLRSEEAEKRLKVGLEQLYDRFVIYVKNDNCEDYARELKTNLHELYMDISQNGLFKKHDLTDNQPNWSVSYNLPSLEDIQKNKQQKEERSRSKKNYLRDVSIPHIIYDKLRGYKDDEYAHPYNNEPNLTGVVKDSIGIPIDFGSPDKTSIDIIVNDFGDNIDKTNENSEFNLWQELKDDHEEWKEDFQKLRSIVSDTYDTITTYFGFKELVATAIIIGTLTAGVMFGYSLVTNIQQLQENNSPIASQYEPTSVDQHKP